MKPDKNREASLHALDRILAAEEHLVPSSGFLAATMDRIREEAAASRSISFPPISFPWPRAIPGILLVAAVLGWAAWQALRAGLPPAPPSPLLVLLNPPALTPPMVRGFEDAGWVVLALAASLASSLLSMRIIRRSSLL